MAVTAKSRARARLRALERLIERYGAVHEDLQDVRRNLLREAIEAELEESLPAFRALSALETAELVLEEAKIERQLSLVGSATAEGPA